MDALKQTTTSTALHLIDAAIRLAITSSPKRLDKRFQMSSSESLHRLSDIAPALWSPGYLPALSDRAVFLPTICHAMANVGGERAKSASLMAKMTEIGRQTTMQGSMSGAAHIELQSNVAVPLWRMLQASMHNPETARRLKPLFTGKHGEDDAANYADHILLDLNQDDEEDEQPSEADSEDAIFQEYDEDGACGDDQDVLDMLLEDHLTSSPIDGQQADFDDILEFAFSHDQRLLRTAWQEEQGREAMSDDLLSVCGSVGALSMAEDGVLESANTSTGTCTIESITSPFRPSSKLGVDNQGFFLV